MPPCTQDHWFDDNSDIQPLCQLFSSQAPALANSLTYCPNALILVFAQNFPVSQLFSPYESSVAFAWSFLPCPVAFSLSSRFSSRSDIVFPLQFKLNTRAMDGYGHILGSFEDYNPQNLPLATLEQMLDSFKQQVLKTEAAKLLLPAKEFPFSRVTLGRLSSFLKLVFNPDKQQDSKIAALRGLDSTSVIVCGLCLTQKAVDSMRKDLFDVFLEQAMIASQRSVHIIAKSDDINKVVLNSTPDEEFLKSKGFLSLYYS